MMQTEKLLSRRQAEVLPLVIAGFSNKIIARELKIAPGTVKSHLAAAFGKLGIRNRLERPSGARARGGRCAHVGQFLQRPVLQSFHHHQYDRLRLGSAIDGVIDRADPENAVPGFQMPPSIPGQRRHPVAELDAILVEPLRNLERAGANSRCN